MFLSTQGTRIYIVVKDLTVQWRIQKSAMERAQGKIVFNGHATWRGSLNISFYHKMIYCLKYETSKLVVNGKNKH